MKCSFGVFGAMAVVLAACMTKGAAPADGAKDSLTTAPVPSLSLEGDWSADHASDPLWVRSSAGDEWAVLELAAREGAEGLLSQLRSGGPAAQAAALAWPHVPTAWAFRGEWCGQSNKYDVVDWAILLRALGESSAQRDSLGEELAPESLGECQRFLAQAERRLASDTDGTWSAVRDTLEAAQSAFGGGNVAREP